VELETGSVIPERGALVCRCSALIAGGTFDTDPATAFDPFLNSNAHVLTARSRVYVNLHTTGNMITLVTVTIAAACSIFLPGRSRLLLRQDAPRWSLDRDALNTTLKALARRMVERES
jgi:hypothetical protein